jgi:hypothetical protein
MQVADESTRAAAPGNATGGYSIPDGKLIGNSDRSLRARF